MTEAFQTEYAQRIVRQLQRILSSSDFDATERNRRFLAFIVEETLNGRADRIKAFGIATMVFGRTEAFDPQLDSIVRIEAGRLRRSMERYYLTGGKLDDVRITIPRGAYVPAFVMVSPSTVVVNSSADHRFAPQLTVAPPRWETLTTICVAQFDFDGDDATCGRLAKSLTRQVVMRLMQHPNVRIHAPETASSPDLRNAFDEVHYLLTGSATFRDGRLLVDALLLDNCTQHYVRSARQEVNCTIKSAWQAVGEVSNAISHALFRSDGFAHPLRFAPAAREQNTAPRKTR